MDDRRFDSLTKAFAAGSNRRSLFKGLLGIGGAGLAGSLVRDGDGEAARRPTTPTPAPVRCPGRQVLSGGQCVCPDGTSKCGPDCCATSIPSPEPGHSECCDNACCVGTCYGEERCCPTNITASGFPTNTICTSANGTECCAFDQACCAIDGCCDMVCSSDGRCCAPEDVCPGGGESPDLCCAGDGAGSSVCCGGGTDFNACYPAAPGLCCTDAECGDPCQVCDRQTHRCVARCDLDRETCCTTASGDVECVRGECCIDGTPGCEDSVCCISSGRTVCLESCISECDGCASASDCCFINEQFVGCVDYTVAGACCTAAECEAFNDFERCLVGACIDFACEQRSSCAAMQYCCSGECSDASCPDPTCIPVGEVCPDPDDSCCAPAVCVADSEGRLTCQVRK